MQFTIQREVFLKPLQRVAGAVERRQAMPILANLLVVVKSQLLSLTGTDLEIEMIARLPLSLEAQAGRTTVPGKKLIDICKALPENALISFELVDQKMIVKAGRSRYTLACLAPENFPQVEESVSDLELSVSSSLLKQALDATCFAMAHQDVRYYLNGLLMTFSANEIRMVATDGHRLATTTLPLKSHLTQPLSVIVPRKAVVEMQRLFAEDEEAISLVIGTNHLRTISKQTSFITKLIEGKFPDYQRVLPGAGGNVLTLLREPLRQALLRVSALFSDRYRGVALQFSTNLLRIVAIAPDKDEVEDELEITYTGPTVEIGVNASYLIEYLNTVRSEQVRLTFTEGDQVILFETDPCVSGSENGQGQHAYVVMPMRL